jgi:anti-sigma B factor antagonist/stage II sporulation protein AA (anti-sigma F factor antagonist)
VTGPTPPAENFLGIETERIDGVEVLRFQNAKILSDKSVQEMGDRLLACLDTLDDPPRLAISFEGVTFLSSAGIGKLIFLQRKVKERGGELLLCDLNKTTEDVFRVAHLTDFFRIYPNLDAALAASAPPDRG